MTDEKGKDRPRLAWDDARTFFLAPEAWREPYELDAAEAHHLTRVLRIREGEEIRILDGQGREGRFIVKACRPRRVELDFVESWEHPKPASGVILAAGWTKAARRGWILEKAVEFEAEGIWMWQAERSQFPVPPDIRDSWQGQLVAGCKQCRNPWLPGLRTFPGGVEELVRGVALLEREGRPVHKVMLAEEGLGADSCLTPARLGAEGLTVCVVGPEGGFARREAERLKQAGFLPVSLGERVLRWETAAVLCLGLYWWRRGLPETRLETRP